MQFFNKSLIWIWGSWEFEAVARPMFLFKTPKHGDGRCSLNPRLWSDCCMQAPADATWKSINKILCVSHVFIMFHMFSTVFIFCGDIPLHRPHINGRYLQFRLLKWPLIMAAILVLDGQAASVATQPKPIGPNKTVPPRHASRAAKWRHPKAWSGFRCWFGVGYCKILSCMTFRYV